MNFSIDHINSSKIFKVLKPDILHFQTIDSTNRFLLETEEFQNGMIVLADFQTAGRGRFDRRWYSPSEAALLFSVLLTEIPPVVGPSAYTFLAAVAVYRGILKNITVKNGLSVKWPNDILLNGKKICGILVQSKISGGKFEKLVIGIGLNVNQDKSFFGKNLKHATSIASEFDGKKDRIEIFTSILEAIDDLLILMQNSGEKPIIDMWQEACDSIGKIIAIDNGKQIYRGIFMGLSEDGGMLLKTDKSIELFYAGDVTILKE